MIVNANEILFRCSSLGKLMTEPQGKSKMEKYIDIQATLDDLVKRYSETANKETKTGKNLLERIDKYTNQLNELRPFIDDVNLSKTCRSHLVEVFINNEYGRERSNENKYIEKGLLVEDDSITLLSRVTKKYYTKNSYNFKNEFIKGTPDIIITDGNDVPTHVIDIKSSWDIFTFFDTKFDEVNSDYYWQLQGYMALTNTKTASLIYCLVNTPDSIINDQKRRVQWKMNVLSDTDQIFIEAADEIDTNSIYDDIDMKKRLFEIKIERNDDDIERLYRRIRDCRKFMNDNFYKGETI